MAPMFLCLNIQPRLYIKTQKHNADKNAMGKKSKTKPVIVKAPIGEPLGIKQLGNLLTVTYAIYDTEAIKEAWLLNSEEGEFTEAPGSPVLYSTYKEVPPPSKGQSLGLVVISKPEKLIKEADGYHLKDETLPFLAGGERGWRNPRYGHVLEQDPENVAKSELAAEKYTEIFPGWDSIYKIEQVIDPMGWSDSLDALIDARIQAIN